VPNHISLIQLGWAVHKSIAQMKIEEKAKKFVSCQYSEEILALPCATLGDKYPNSSSPCFDRDGQKYLQSRSAMIPFLQANGLSSSLTLFGGGSEKETSSPSKIRLSLAATRSAICSSDSVLLPVGLPGKRTEHVNDAGGGWLKWTSSLRNASSCNLSYDVQSHR
jgi:hypothetical protein